MYTIRDLHPDTWRKAKQRDEETDSALYPPRLLWSLGDYHGKQAMTADMPLATYLIVKHPSKDVYMRSITELHPDCRASSIPDLHIALVGESITAQHAVQLCSNHWAATLKLFQVSRQENNHRSSKRYALLRSFDPVNTKIKVSEEPE